MEENKISVFGLVGELKMAPDAVYDLLKKTIFNGKETSFEKGVITIEPSTPSLKEENEKFRELLERVEPYMDDSENHDAIKLHNDIKEALTQS